MTASVPPALGGMRLDQALARLFPQYSRNRLQAWLKSGHITIDGRRLDPNHAVTGGEAVALQPPRVADAAAPQAQRMPLKVVFEDAALIVIDKPAGLVVHPGAGQPDRTLLNALLAHAPALAAVPRGGIVHRLDKDTSGLLVVAKTVEAQVSLVKQLADHSMRRVYLAVVQGDPPASGVIDAPVGRDVRARTRMAVTHRGSRAGGMPPRDRSHPPDPSSFPAPAPSAGGRRDLSARHAPRHRLPAPGAARDRADPRPPDHGQGGELVGAVTAGHEAADRRAAQVIQPGWAAPARVRALVTTRDFGDLADEAARRKLRALLPAEPSWLKQVHGTRVIDLDQDAPGEADAAVTRNVGTVCVVKAADCLPVLFADADGTTIAAAHAGWRGLAGGVLEATVAAMGVPQNRIVAWLGPAIGPQVYEVGEDVYRAFSGYPHAFVPTRPGHWRLDLYAVARAKLKGLKGVSGGEFCTYSQRERFFSFRRERTAARMAAAIWLESTPP